MRIWVLTCSWSAVKLVRALLAGLGWFTSCSEGTAPSTFTPFPTANHIRMSGIKLKLWFHTSWMNGYGINIVRSLWTIENDDHLIQRQHIQAASNHSPWRVWGCPACSRSAHDTGPSHPPRRTLLLWTAVFCRRSKQNKPGGRCSLLLCGPSRLNGCSCHSERNVFRISCQKEISIFKR